MNELEVGCSCGLKVLDDDDGGTERGVEVYMQASGKGFPWCLILRSPAPQPRFCLGLLSLTRLAVCVSQQSKRSSGLILLWV
jgi:hypothetical protein